MLKINADLVKKIAELLAVNPKADEDTLVDLIVGSNSVRMTKNAIKVGVNEYFRNKQAKAQLDRKEQPITVVQVDKPKKKVKRGELEMQFEDHPSYVFDKMGAIEEVYQDINNNIFMPIEKQKDFLVLGVKKFKGFLIAGPAGCGKTYLSNCIISHMKNKYRFNAYSVHAGMLVASDAQQNVKKLFQAGRENLPSVIFIDDIDILCNKQTAKRPQGSPIITLLAEMQKIKQENVYLLSTSSNPQKLDVSLKKLNRFEKTITLNMSSDPSREKILVKLLQQTAHSLTSLDIVEISKSTSGYMAADLMMLVKQAGLHALISRQAEEPRLTLEDFIYSMQFVQPLMKKEGFTDIPKTTLDDVGGLKNLKLELEREIIIPMRKQARFKQFNFEVQSGGVLLYGPPGCGKTMIAKAIANAVRANFIIVKGPELLNKYVGESQQAVREVFGRAQRASPCVIFFDQFDALAPKRSDQGNQVTERVVNTLLTALDGVEERKMVFVIAATNRKDMIDEATLRAGRIQKHLYVPQPTQQERVQILKAITKRMKIKQDITFDEIAKQTKGFSGADLKFLVKQATVTAVMEDRNEVEMQDLMKSLKQLMEAKKQDTLKQKVHQLQLQDGEENQNFTYHVDSSNRNGIKQEVEVDSTMVTKKKPALFDEFLKFLANKARK